MIGFALLCVALVLVLIVGTRKNHNLDSWD